MTCSICREGRLVPGTATVTVQRGETTVIIRGVPADVCDNCSEYYLTTDVAEVVFSRANEAVQRRAEVEIIRYAA